MKKQLNIFMILIGCLFYSQATFGQVINESFKEIFVTDADYRIESVDSLNAANSSNLPGPAAIQAAPVQVINEGFDDVFGAYENDGDVPVDGWIAANRSDTPGPTGMFPGIVEASGYFDAQAGAAHSYLAMNYNNALLTAANTTSHWLITPEIEFNDRDRISFWTRTIEGSLFPDRLVARMSIAGDSIDVGDNAFSVGDFTMLLEDINPMNLVGGYPEQWTRYEFELSGFESGDSGRIALQYFNTNMNVNGSYIGIDSFQYIPFLLGDGNGDGVLTLLDVQFLVDLLTSGGFSEVYDFNNDGLVTLEDVQPFIDALVGQ